MNYLERSNCRNGGCCDLWFGDFAANDGYVDQCRGCNKQYVAHMCHSRPIPEFNWLPILLTCVSIACPGCARTYQIANKVAEAQATPEGLRAVAGVVAVGAVFVGVIKLGELVRDSIGRA